MEQSELNLLRQIGFKKVIEGDLTWHEKPFTHPFFTKGEIVIENNFIFINCEEPEGDGEVFTLLKCKFERATLNKIFKWLKIPY